MDYRHTLNLPRTEFPMRASLPQREPEIQRAWEEMDLYRRAQRKNRGRPQYLLHDGPPYTSGDIHLGQALNKILKDIVVKLKTMQGFDSPYVPGWDTHGLPTEMRVIEALLAEHPQQQTGDWRSMADPLELRRRCAETAHHFVDVQRRQFKRLGVRGDWDHPYLTLDPTYEAAVVRVFGAMVAAGCVYRRLKPVLWCPACQTALAEAEIEYHAHTSPSIYVKFALLDQLEEVEGPVYGVIWTTTPWTLPANVAVAFHPDYTYQVVRADGQNLLLARELVEPTLQAAGLSSQQVLAEFPGRRLEGVRFQHPFLERQSVGVLATYVTLDQGTGLVHTAPGHGEEDYWTGLQYQLPIVQPLDERGVFTSEGGRFAGMPYHQADQAILAHLRSVGALLAEGRLEHQYPYCWRSDDPVIYRATEQWFVDVHRYADQALAEIERVRWVPEWGRERIANMVADRPDWCISRQRAWGIPIVAFYCQHCQELLLTPEVVEQVASIFETEGSDAWFRRPAEELLPAGTRCPKCSGQSFRKENDIVDVWLESGSSHRAVLRARPELGWPADLYLEGHDQYRGWFQSSLWTGLIASGQAPYRTVLTTGFVLDAHGRKMSKRLGNVIDPQQVVAELGADVLRLWVAYVDFKNDMFTGPDIFQQVVEAYRRIRNTARFLLSNLYDFQPARDRIPVGEMAEVDRWALHRLQEVVARVSQAYQEFEFHRVYHTLQGFCTTDLSAFYLDMLKDRLYTSPAASAGRRSAQTVLYQLAVALAQLLAPVISHTAEEIWQHLPGETGRAESVQLSDWPVVDQALLDSELGRKWDRLLEIRAEVAKALEVARSQQVIGQPLEASVTIFPPEEDRPALASLDGELASMLIVSQAGLASPQQRAPEEAFSGQQIPGLAVWVERASGSKCARCWLTLPTVGSSPQHPGLCHRCLEAVKGGELDAPESG